ncbi:MAG TPA: outer membrane beta-barrel protein [Vicinamibacterales bacterium]|nr:outer membrane beta-barrel protein [Vicinamibacterales bacterium]
MTGAHTARLCIGVLCVLAASTTPALAQRSRVEVGVGGVFNGAADAGSEDAALLDAAGGSLRLFRASNRMASGWGAEGLVSTRVGERLRLELAVGWGSTDFETRLSDDFEDVPALSVTQKVNQFTGELALAYRIVQRGRFDVFVRAGGGGFREITGDRALVENGWRGSVGGGTQIRLRDASSGWLGRLALRADLRVHARGGGIAFGDSGTRLSPSVFAGLVIGK